MKNQNEIEKEAERICRELTGCYKFKTCSWNIFCQAIEFKEKEMLDDEINWLEEIWEDRASYSLTENNIQARLKELKKKLEGK